MIGGDAPYIRAVMEVFGHVKISVRGGGGGQNSWKNGLMAHNFLEISVCLWSEYRYFGVSNLMI